MIRRFSQELQAIRASQVLDDGQSGSAPRDQALVHALLSAKEQHELVPAPSDLSRRVMSRVCAIEPNFGASPWRFRANILQWLVPASVAAIVAVGGVSLIIGTVGTWHGLMPHEPAGSVMVARPTRPANVPAASIEPAPMQLANATPKNKPAPVLVSERRTQVPAVGNTIASTQGSDSITGGSALWSAIERPLVREAKALTSDTSQVAKMIMETLPTRRPAPDQ